MKLFDRLFIEKLILTSIFWTIILLHFWGWIEGHYNLPFPGMLYIIPGILTIAE